MQHECKITVLETKVFPELQEKYLADPKSGPSPCFKVGDTFLLKRTLQQDDFYHLMNGKFCGEAWDAISRYVYTALQGGSIMHSWTNDERMMIACCNDGTRPVIFKIERIDIPENEEEKQWLKRKRYRKKRIGCIENCIGWCICKNIYKFQFVALLRTASAVLCFYNAKIYSFFSDGLVDINLYSLVFLGKEFVKGTILPAQRISPQPAGTFVT